MADQTEPKKTTPESTKRYRLALAALKNLDQAEDYQVPTALAEFQAFMELYVAARGREVDSRAALSPRLSLDSVASDLDAKIQRAKSMYGGGDTSKAQKVF